MDSKRRAKAVVTAVIIAALAVLGVALILKLYPGRPGPWEQVRITTATRGGTFYPLGSQLARILERLPDKPIENVSAIQSAGSYENVRRLLSSKAEVAFVIGPALAKAAEEMPEARERLRILARLYRDVVQIVVRKDTDIESIADFKNRRIFVGLEGSGTRTVATRILDAIGLSAEDYVPDDAQSFAEAASKLTDARLNAAFFIAGMPAAAVQAALESGRVRLLNLDSETREALTTPMRGLGLVEEYIPANFYPNQPEAVETVGADVFLVARDDLPDDLAIVVLTALLDNISDLLLAHPKAQDIRLTEAFNLPEGFPFPLHPGARRFQEEQDAALLVATGALKGTYYQLGMMIQSLLNERGIPARAIQTDGSLENAELLGTRPTIAIMQYDAALASRFGEPRFVYNVDLSNRVSIPPVQNIRRIAALHEEQVHVVIRRGKLADIEARLNEQLPRSEPVRITTLSQLAEALSELSSEGEKLRVSLGARRSATQVVAQAILEHHGVDSTAIIPSFLSVSDMANRLHGEEIDAGFFVSHVPSAAIEIALNDPRIRLLSLGSNERALMTGTVFSTSSIDSTYACQREGEPAIQTIATRAVLVTTDDLRFDVKAITRAIFEGEAFLSIAGGAKAMAEDLPSLPLHRKAKRYYEEAGLLPTKPPFDWLAATWRALASIVILVSGCRGLLKLRRDRVFNEMSRRIIAIPVEARSQESVASLLEMRAEIQERVRKRWWQRGELDKGRWRYLYELVNDRMTEAKDNLTRTLAAEIRCLTADPAVDDTTRRKDYRSIQSRVREFFEKGQLDASQLEIVRALIEESSQRGSDGPENQGDSA